MPVLIQVETLGQYDRLNSEPGAGHDVWLPADHYP